MTLDEVPSGQCLFLDANIFIYHFTGRSPSCRRLFERSTAGEVQAICGVHIVHEVLHRLMVLEALQKRLVTPGNVVRKLKEKPEIIKGLVSYQRDAGRILALGVEVLPVDLNLILASRGVRQRFGLLTDDSLSVALMEQQGVSSIASLDGDFARIPGIKVYAPELV